MMRSWIDFNRNRISSLLRCFGYFLTRFRRSPVIILANEDQQRRERLVDPRQVGMPATQPNSATRVERYRGGEPPRFSRVSRSLLLSGATIEAKVVVPPCH